MSPRKSRSAVTYAVAFLLPLLSMGCATRRFVRNHVHDTVAPVEARVGTEEQKTAENTTQIRDLDQKTERGISDAQKRADDAAQAASKADQDAQSANQLAQKGVDQSLQVKEELANVDKFQPMTKETILFRFNRSDLTKDDKQTLDQIAEKVKSLQHYVIQVQAFTDKTGDDQYNLELSHRRAEAVVRYLTLDHQIPLVRIYELGYGEAAPVASNRSRKDREKNRRAEVTIMVPQTVASSNQPSTSPSATLQQQ